MPVRRGGGVEGTVEGFAGLMGHAGFACGGEDDGSIWLGDGKRSVARFGVRESARIEAGEALAALRELGLRVHLSSGASSAAVARQTGSASCRESVSQYV